MLGLSILLWDLVAEVRAECLPFLLWVSVAGFVHFRQFRGRKFVYVH